ncbi:FecCD family ABC transporter permease [Streptomyces sp. NPDC048182]|uniref:FecCD family ABC transporter permease n=1 Tax=Streptomyces sp. NPDC048182 TaxID=3365507 RepID=UPI0037188AF3
MPEPTTSTAEGRQRRTARDTAPHASPSPRAPDPAPDAAVALTARRLRDARRRANRRTLLVACVLAAALVGLLACSLLLGGLRGIAGQDVVPAAFGRRTGLADYVVHRIRMPRALAALLSGALFGLSGALYQRLIRNPLATPDIVGISAGSGAGAVTVLLFAAELPFGVELGALGGSFAMVAVLLALSRRAGRVDTYRLVLIGIGLAAVCTAYVDYLLTMAGEQSRTQMLRWLVGSVSGADWDGVTTLAAGLAACLLAAAPLGRALGALAVGDQLAAGLGTRVGAARTATLLLGAAAAALATSVTGPIGFVSLVSGPIAARLVGADRAVGLAVPVGAVIVLAADVAAQHAPQISPVPTGVLTALLGAPYFVWLILRRGPGAPS